MPTEIETARLAAAINLLRPEWPAASIATVIRTSQAHRPLHDLAVALAYIATDPETKTPGRINERGPWWNLAHTERTSYGAPMTPCCRTCGFHHRAEEDHYRRQAPTEAAF